LKICQDKDKNLARLKDVDVVIKDFVARVELRAEEKMLKTGKLEGAHYAAMKEIAKSLKGVRK